MRIFCSQPSINITVVRKMGYYPSYPLARRAASAIRQVLDLKDEEFVPILASYFTGEREAWEWLISRMAPADYRAVLGFCDWYSGEIVREFQDSGVDVGYEMDFENLHSTYVVHNLNTGASVCFISNRIRLESYSEVPVLSAIAERE